MPGGGLWAVYREDVTGAVRHLPPSGCYLPTLDCSTLPLELLDCPSAWL